MDELESEVQQIFLEESRQMLTDAEQCFLSLETAADKTKDLNDIFRLVHNIKGSARAVGFEGIGEFAHEFESFLLKLKTQELPLDSAAVTLLLRCNDHLRKTVDALSQDVSAQVDNTELLALLRAASSGAAPKATPTPAASTEAALPEEPLPASMPGGVLIPSEPIHKPAAAVEESIRVNLKRLETLTNNVGELVILQAVLGQHRHLVTSPLLQKTIAQLGKITKEIQDISMGLRMIPLKQTFQGMHRVVRDAAQMLNKTIQVQISGEETDVDKTVLEHLGNPLVHLVRNSVDHGIESAIERHDAGKPPEGVIQINAYHRSGQLVIDVRDDGRGLDPAKIRAKAIQSGLIRADDVLSESDIYALIFRPGFSTKTEVSEISGRGVGLDVVKTNIENLHGKVEVQTVLGKGTVFRITLPLTLAIIESMIVAAAQERYILPMSHVHETVQPKKQDVHMVTNLGETMNLRGETMPLYRLSSLLRLRVKSAGDLPAESCIAIVCRFAERTFAVLVDDILMQQQVVVKKLGAELQGQNGITGSAILGDGRPALILDLQQMTDVASIKGAA